MNYLREICKGKIQFETNTPFGRAKVLCEKKDDKIILNIFHAMFNHKIEIDKKECEDTLKGIMEWVQKPLA